MFLHAVRQSKVLADGDRVDVAVKVDPLAAIVGPCLAAKRLFETGREDRAFKGPEVLARHRAAWIVLRTNKSRLHAIKIGNGAVLKNCTTSSISV